MVKRFVSVVIAAKDPAWELLQLCVGSFAALKSATSIQLVIVQSGGLPELEGQLKGRFFDYKVINVQPQGVYSAYNAGIHVATGSYVLFFGIDDVALPGMDVVIGNLLTCDQEYYLFAAACYMQSVGVAYPSKRRSSLILRNWCHQGIFYLRKYLAEHPYQTEYRAQADHKMNIDIVSNSELRFGVTRELVAYFSSGGISSMSPDLQFRRDFPSIVAQSFGRPFGMLVKLKQLFIDLVLGRPDQRFRARTRN